MSTITTPSPVHMASRSLIKAILLAGLVAGTLDIIAAVTVNGIMSGEFKPLRILQGIASGAIGRSAFEGGVVMGLVGLVFHYCFALMFATVYFLLFPYLPFLQRYPLLWGCLYGIVAWAIMNGLVIPLSKLHPAPFNWERAAINIVILMFMIGLPIALMARKYYSKKRQYPEN